MLRRVLRSKIHRATVTQAHLDYQGSIALPPYLIEAADLAESEAVWIWNVTTGTRLETYIINSGRTDGEISINGAAAHLVSPSDIVIIAAFGYLESRELERHLPKAVFVNERNQIIKIGQEQVALGPSYLV